jgi:hypothetical protein
MPDVTERARELRDSGLSFRLIAETLNAEGYRGKKGGIWHDGSVFRLLQPPKPPGPGRQYRPHTEESKRKMSESHKKGFAEGRRTPTRVNAEKTHCPKGHPYDEENTRLIPGGRACKECGRESVRRRRRLQRQANPRPPRPLPEIVGEMDYRMGSPGRRAYGTAHYRNRRVRGNAKRRRCAHCAERGVDKRARDWAKLRDRDGRDVMDYIPLCRRCHFYYDRGLVPPEPVDRKSRTRASRGARRRPDAETAGVLGDPALGQKRAEQQRAKTHCPAGHEYTPENTYVIKRAGVRTARQCKTCTKAKAAERAARRRERDAAPSGG